MNSGQEIVTEARRWLGTPYRHQGSHLGAGADCLGLLRGVWRKVVGPEPEVIPPYTMDWSEPAAREDLLHSARRWLIEADATQPIRHGEVILFRMSRKAVAKHLGIAATDGKFPTMIHAYSGHGVVETPLSIPWELRIAARFTFPIGV